MKALIYGAGKMGKAAGWDLEQHGVDVFYADIYEKKSKNYIKLDSSYLDLVKLFKDFDCVLGTAGYDLNYQLSEAAISAGTNFCDLGGNNNIVHAQLNLNNKAKEKNVCIVPDCGLAPGTAGILAAYAIEFMGYADKVSIYVGGLPRKSIEPIKYGLTWSVRGLINEYIEPCKIIRDCELIEVEPLTEVETIIFPTGRFEAFHTSGGLSTLADTYANKIVDLEYKTIRYPGHANLFMSMKKLGFFDDSNREFTEKILETNIPKIDDDKVYIRIKALNHDEGVVEINVAEYKDEIIGHTAMARMTGYSIATVAYYLMKSNTNYGVLTGERLFNNNLQWYVDELRKRGIKIHITNRWLGGD